MGSEESLFTPKNNAQRLPLPPGWRYTVKTLDIENRVIPINKERYRFIKELGAGAFGSVYSAHRVSDKKPVAIKIVSLVTLSSGEAETLANSILTEIEMSARLSRATSHVINMFDFDFHRQTGLAFLVMELGEKDLEKVLRDRPQLSSFERKSIWRQLVKIAVVLHDNNIVHLDIKPQNLVVFSGNKIKLADLGIAQKAYRPRYGCNGTWLYSAPEVTLADKSHMTMNTTSKADAWSWGAVLYRMTYHRPPEYNPPCHHPPKNIHRSRDNNLVDVLRHTLVMNPAHRADAPWLARHPYTIIP